MENGYFQYEYQLIPWMKSGNKQIRISSFRIFLIWAKELNLFNFFTDTRFTWSIWKKKVFQGTAPIFTV